MSGKEMFEFHPELFVDDDEAFVADDYVGNPEDDVPEVIINVTGTSISLTRKGAAEGEQLENVDADLFKAEDIPDENGEGGDAQEGADEDGEGDGEAEEGGEEEEADDVEDGEDDAPPAKAPPRP